MHVEVVAGRECGSCTVCCTALTINDPELQKVQGYRCPNLRPAPDSGCGIYHRRPAQCRNFDCGWRLLRWVKEGLKPDRSRVLLRLQRDKDGKLGVVVTLLDRSALKAEGLAETVAAAVAGGAPVFLQIPGPPGFTSAQARIDEALALPVATRDKAGVLAVLRTGLQQGRVGDFQPIRLRPRPEAPGG